MASLKVPSEATIKRVIENTSAALSDRLYECKETEKYLPKICAVCDGMATIQNPTRKLQIDKFIDYCEKANAHKAKVSFFYPPSLIDQYTADDSRLSNYLLSPRTIIDKNAVGKDSVLVCTECSATLEKNSTRKNARLFVSPEKAIWRGRLVGEAPDCIKDLNPAELALLSPNRVVTHAITMYANHHDGMYGWHTMFENKVENNFRDLNHLIESGMNGEIVCVLCGPFTKTQNALLRKSMTVRVDKMKAAFEWLQKNNGYFGQDRFTIPVMDNIRQPIIIEDSSL